MKKFLHPQKSLFALLLALFLGMGTANAYDFYKNCSTGQRLYYNIIDATNHYVEITYPGYLDVEYIDPWEGYTQPTGNITLPSSVTYNNVTYTVKAIGEFAFFACSDMTGSLTIPNSVTIIDEDAFWGCTGFTGSLTIPNSVTSIRTLAFAYCDGFTGSLTIPDSVTSIGSFAFFECSSFTGSLTIPNSVISIGSYTFESCTGFTSLIIGNSVSTINNGAFNGCTNLNYMIVLPDTPPTLGTDAFYDVPTTIPVYVPCGSLWDYKNASGWSEFNNIYRISNDCDLLTYSINADGVSVTVTGHVDGTAATGTLTIPATKTIDGVTYAVTAIGESAFEMCTQLTGSLTIPNSVTTIGNSAFRYCFGFNGSLTIGSSVRNIGSYAFWGCSGFTSMTVLPETPPSLGTSVFSNVPTGIPVYVPCGSLWDYRDASGWSVFSNIQCLLETLTVYDGTVTNNRIPAYIFYFDGFTRSQFVIPAADLVEMKDKPISRMTFYTTNSNVPYITDCSVDVYLKTVNYTSISSYETKASCTTVYSGFLNIISTNSGGEMTIYFDSPYTYNGGNLLVGFENTEDNTYQNIHFYGQTVSGASISGASASSTGTIPATQQNFIPKTSFGYLPTCETKSLPYAFGFEEDGEEYCWTMLNCYSTTGLYNSTDAYEGDYCFRFYYTVNPPQYLISPKFEGTTGMNVSFYYKNGSSSWPESFQVGYSTTTQTPNAFIWGEEVTVNSPNDWLLYEDSFPEGTKYVAVKCTSDDQLYLYLDNFSFEPAYCAPEDQCELTFTLTDSYGDGWNGNAIRVVDVASNTVLATMTNVTNDQANAPITETYTLPACNGRILRFEWVKGTWSSECSYTVTNAYGTVILEGTGSNSMNTGDVLGTYLMSCDGLDCWHPFALDATETTSHSATLSWTGYQDSYNVRYREKSAIMEDFDNGMQGWTTIDADGDGYDWVLSSEVMMTGCGHNGSTDMVMSCSYSNDVGALYPDNYLVSPQVSLDGIFSFWARAQDDRYPAEHFGVAVSTTSNTDASAFTTIQEWTMTAKSSGAKATPGATRGDNRGIGTWYQYTVDLSAYAGQMGYVAIRHFNCSDQFFINVDDIYMGFGTGSTTWVTVENVTNPYTLTGLFPETQYEWQVQGINTDCDGGLTSWSDKAFFTTTEETEVTQTIALAAGINWFSTNVEITLDDLKAALVATGGTNIVIKAKSSSTTWNGHRWLGSLNGFNVNQMYMITVQTACEITLVGMPLSPAEHPVTISNGANWIGYPLNESMTLTEAFSGFPTNQDVVKSKNASATWNGHRWVGQLSNLVPGQGYIYQSKASGNKTFTFPSGAK